MIYEMRLLIPTSEWVTFKIAVDQIWFDSDDAKLTLHKSEDLSGIDGLATASFESENFADLMLVWRVIPDKGLFRYAWTDMTYEQVHRPRS